MWIWTQPNIDDYYILPKYMNLLQKVSNREVDTILIELTMRSLLLPARRGRKTRKQSRSSIMFFKIVQDYISSFRILLMRSCLRHQST